MKKNNMYYLLISIFAIQQIGATPSLTSMVSSGPGMAPKLSLKSQNPQLTINPVISGSDNSSVGRYDSQNNTAWLYNPTSKKLIHYTNITVQRNAGTPPPHGEKFATMQNPNYQTPTSMIMGGPLKVFNLWGTQVEADNTIHRMMPKPNIKITGINGEHGIYNPDNQTALIYSNPLMEYTNIVEYKQAVTPPNIMNTALVRFATMPNPNFTGEMMPGGQFKNIVLYGVPNKLSEKSLATAHSHNTVHNYINDRKQYMDHIAESYTKRGLPAPPIAP